MREYHPSMLTIQQNNDGGERHQHRCREQQRGELLHIRPLLTPNVLGGRRLLMRLAWRVLCNKANRCSYIQRGVMPLPLFGDRSVRLSRRGDGLQAHRDMYR